MIAEHLDYAVTDKDLSPEFTVAAISPEFEVYEVDDREVTLTLDIDDILGIDDYKPRQV